MRDLNQKIISNSARCTACKEEIQSLYRHHFNVHYCKVEPTPRLKWTGEGPEQQLVKIPGEFTYRFAVDGGNAYIRRVGEGFEETSIYEES